MKSTVEVNGIKPGPMLFDQKRERKNTKQKTPDLFLVHYGFYYLSNKKKT